MAYGNMVGQFLYKTPVLRAYFDQLAENDFWLKSNGWQDSVKVVFFQASVPTGWTQDASANDKFLRVVNNQGSNPGGAVGGSIAASSGINLAHTHTLTSEGTHTHAGAATHSSMHKFIGGYGLIGSTVSSSKSPGLYGIGDVVAQFNQNGSGTTGPGNWGVGSQSGLNVAITDNNPTTAGGSHNHTLTSSLGTFSPAYVDAIVGIKSTSSGYTDLTSFFNHNDRVRYEPFNNAGGLWFNDEFNNGRVTPTGTVAVFYNSSAPAGWTKLTTQNDKALRIVSGAGGGGGGSLGIGQAFAISHNHPISSNGTHSHTTGTHRHDVMGAQPGSLRNRVLIAHPSMNGAAFDTGIGQARATTFDSATQSKMIKGRSTLAGGSLTTGTDPDHAHTIGSNLSNFVLAYIDMIQCQKLSTGAPYAYTSLLGLVVYKKLVTKQRLDMFAKNDEFVRFHTIPAGSVMAFYQSATPLNWTVLNAQHDKVLRVVSGAGGGSGGSQLISAAINLAHTHTVSSYVHSHSIPSHSHNVDSESYPGGSFVSVDVISSGSSMYCATHDVLPRSGDGNLHGGPYTGGPTNCNALTEPTTAVTAQTLTQSHNHGGASSSALGSYTFAYANVILCQKN